MDVWWVPNTIMAIRRCACYILLTEKRHRTERQYDYRAKMQSISASISVSGESIRRTDIKPDCELCPSWIRMLIIPLAPFRLE